jgi:multiple sugar transport system permease protein
VRKPLTGILLVAPAVAVLVFLFVYPFIFNVWTSLYQLRPLVSPDRTFIGLSNYATTFNDYVFQVSIRNTLVFTGASVVLEFFLGLGVAFLLTSLPRGRKAATVLLLIPMLMPDVVTTLGWKFIFSPNFGVLNYLLGFSVPWLSSPSFAMVSVVIADVWKTIPFVMIIMVAGILSIPKEHVEAIRTDGANSLQQFRYLTFPYLIPFVLIAITVRTIDAFTKVYTVVYLLTSGGPGIATEVLPISISRLALLTWDWGRATTYSTIALIISMLFLAVFLRVIRRK